MRMEKKIEYVIKVAGKEVWHGLHHGKKFGLYRNHELRAPDNDTNLLRFGIRATRLFVQFAIPAYLMPLIQD